MIALLSEKSRRKQQPKPPAPTFEELLPSITKQARIAFRDKPRSEREELIAEVVANCFVAYVRLLERGLGISRITNCNLSGSWKRRIDWALNFAGSR